jgi:hypothetical protein
MKRPATVGGRYKGKKVKEGGRLGAFGAPGGPAGEDGSVEAAAGSEFAADNAPFGTDGGDDVVEHFVDGVFVKNTEIPVSE